MPTLEFIHDALPESARAIDDLLDQARAQDEAVRAAATGATYAGDADPYKKPRADEDDAEDQTVVAPFFPGKKMAQWWLVVGEPRTKQLLTIKRVTVAKTLRVKLEFALPAGEHRPQLLVICDSYMGADHDLQLDPIEVAEGEDSDSDEEMDSGSEE